MELGGIIVLTVSFVTILIPACLLTYNLGKTIREAELYYEFKNAKIGDGIRLEGLNEDEELTIINEE